MAHRVTAPAMQRAQRLLDQRITPHIFGDGLSFDVMATEEFFTSPDFREAISSPVKKFSLGTKWGRPWHTRWFHLTATVPAELAGKPLVAHLDVGFIGGGDGFQVEAMAWRDGARVQAVQPDRRIVHLGTPHKGDVIELWIEAAATPIIAGHEHGFGPTPFGDPATAPTNPLYTFRTARLCVFRADVQEMAIALHTTINLCLDLETHSPARARIFSALEKCDQALNTNDFFATLPHARKELDAVLGMGNGPSAHRIAATGHAHLDTAWLWPIRETRRKVVRTFANALSLLKANPDYVFCHSQAQHYAWVAQDAPEVFEEVKRFVALGRWEIVGGMWVETDLNLPSGESLLRQLVQGQRSFQDWFNTTCRGAFLPDDFGYPAGLPQIVAHAGCEWFFTQKLSWNETNKMPHHSFWWEGLDGTKVFAHFSPIDTYNALLLPSQLRFAERNYRDHAGSSHSLVLYGHGDGGGGPTQTMIERGRLAHDLDQVPRVTFSKVDQFFTQLMDEYQDDAPVWNGEMYFEKHRGTYSTQIGTKQGNRWSERLLHELELWSATVGFRPATIDELWQRVLTQQFHDIIPGSSIAWVHQDAEAEFAAVAEEIEVILARLIPVEQGPTHVLNPAPVAIQQVIDVDGVPAWVNVAPFSTAATEDVLPEWFGEIVHVREDKNEWHINNGHLYVSISHDGTITSLSNGARNVLPEGQSPTFTLRNDRPAEYDAWDIDMADANAPATMTLHNGVAALVEHSPMRAIVECSYATEASQFTVRYTISAGSPRLDISLDANWQENEQRLQWCLPTDVHAREAVFGTQFGHVRRPRHANTSWDLAQFEVCGHRYAAVHEPRFGVALLADGPRGYDVRDNQIRLTVLRAPRFPDPFADRGRQKIEWSVLLTDGDPIVHGIELEASRIAHPLRIVDGVPQVTPFHVDVDIDGVMISALKPADNDNGDIIIRLWETTGGRANGALTVPGFAVVSDCDALEVPCGDAWHTTDGAIQLTLEAFQIRTLRLSK